MNLYAYVGNDPLNNTDPTGMIIDTIADVGFIAYDLYEIATAGATATNVAALGADVAGAAVPFATGGGAAVRAAHAVNRPANYEEVALPHPRLRRLKRPAVSASIARKMVQAQGDHAKTLNTYKNEVVKREKCQKRRLRPKRTHRTILLLHVKIVIKSTRLLKLGNCPGQYTPPNPNERIKDKLGQ